MAAMPLNRGVLTSTYADGKEVGDEKDIRGLMLPRFMKENKEKNEALVRYATRHFSSDFIVSPGVELIYSQPIPISRSVQELHRIPALSCLVAQAR